MMALGLVKPTACFGNGQVRAPACVGSRSDDGCCTYAAAPRPEILSVSVTLSFEDESGGCA